MTEREMRDHIASLSRAEESGFRSGHSRGFFHGLLWGMGGAAVLVIGLSEILWRTH